VSSKKTGHPAQLWSDPSGVLRTAPTPGVRCDPFASVPGPGRGVRRSRSTPVRGAEIARLQAATGPSTRRDSSVVVPQPSRRSRSESRACTSSAFGLRVRSSPGLLPGDS
jgi:hypothetical protein